MNTLEKNRIDPLIIIAKVWNVNSYRERLKHTKDNCEISENA